MEDLQSVEVLWPCALEIAETIYAIMQYFRL